jgi:V/A-type H+-transporting ATPase subunit K
MALLETGWLNNIATGTTLAFLAMVLPIAFAGWGSAKGVGMVAEAAGGLVSESPEKYGKLLILVALPGTQGLYGFVVSFMIMIKIGVFTGMLGVTLAEGLSLLAAAMPIAIVGYFSAIAQARAAIGAVGIVAKHPEEMSKGIVLTAMVETYAILALLGSVMMLTGITIKG